MNELEKARQIINDTDREMASLFEKRMKAAELIADYKKKNSLPILDKKREREVVTRNSDFITDTGLRDYYTDFITGMMKISRDYQSNISGVSLIDTHNIHIGEGLCRRADEIFNLDRKVLIVTDDGVPHEYAEHIASRCSNPVIVTVKQGEKSKSPETLKILLEKMLSCGFDRGDCAVAVGGGMVGDLTGFAASCYMRGIDFYNIPTTVLSQIDSSVGGKTAVNFRGIKNIIGAFYQPRGVITDISLLKTLPSRQVSNGLAEAVKIAVISDKSLFEMFEGGISEHDFEQIIKRCIELKLQITSADEREKGQRKALNFGHTLGHGIEQLDTGLYHGECVALGMLPMCSDKVRVRLTRVLEKLSLPTSLDFDREMAFEAIKHDKKSSEDGIITVISDEIGEYRFVKMDLNEIKSRLYSL